jgi:predicted nucleotidyltransferase
MESPLLAEIGVRYRIRLLLQHGSTVAGRTHAGSDVDLAVLFEPGAGPLANLAALAADLQPLFPGRELDLAPIDHADPLFLKKILEQCRLLFGSRRHLAELRIYAFRRYQDHRRFLALERTYVSRSLTRTAAR